MTARPDLLTWRHERQGGKTLPSLIIVNTVIGFGSPNRQGSYKVHGSPLGEDELRLAKKTLLWNAPGQFFVPDDVHDRFLKIKENGKTYESDWQQEFFRYSRSFPGPAEELRGRMSGEFPKGWDSGLRALHGQETLSRGRRRGGPLNSPRTSRPSWADRRI
jgi:transketolase